MRSIDRLEYNRRINSNKQRPSPDESLEDELEHKKFSPINTDVSIFDNNQEKNFGGINTAPSIFDSGAIFRTVNKFDDK